MQSTSIPKPGIRTAVNAPFYFFWPASRLPRSAQLAAAPILFFLAGQPASPICAAGRCPHFIFSGRRVFSSPGVGWIHFEFLLNFHPNSKWATVASKWDWYNNSCSKLILSEEINTFAEPYGNSDTSTSPVGLRKVRQFLSLESGLL